MSTVNDAKLVQLNREMQIAALREAGIEVYDGAGFEEISRCMLSCASIRPVCIATVYKGASTDKLSKGTCVSFEQDEWDNLSANRKADYVVLGLRIRADGKDFVIRDADWTSVQWSSETQDIPGFANVLTSKGLYDDWDAENKTTFVCQYASTRSAKYFATTVRAYKACTEAANGIDDPLIWSMPTIAYLHILHRHLDVINAALERYFGTSAKFNPTHWYHSIQEYNNTYNAGIYIGSGLTHNVYAKNSTNTNAYRCRAISVSATFVPFATLSL